MLDVQRYLPTVIKIALIIDTRMYTNKGDTQLSSKHAPMGDIPKSTTEMHAWRLLRAVVLSQLCQAERMPLRAAATQQSATWLKTVEKAIVHRAGSSSFEKCASRICWSSW